MNDSWLESFDGRPGSRRGRWGLPTLALIASIASIAPIASIGAASAGTTTSTPTAAGAAAGTATSTPAAGVGVRPSAAAHLGAPGGPNVVRVHRDDRGFKLQVDGRDFMVFGMNWDYMPVGENYTYDFWGKPDAIIEEALRREMTLLRDMGVNAIRVGIEIPPRWVTHIYEKYGVYSIINHYIGRYGFMVDGVWRSPIDYADPYVREVIEADVLAAVERFRGTPGVLMWLLGNENNYGLYWASAEIENLPLDRQNDTRAVFLYTLFGQIIDRIKATDDLHPVAMANGDLQYLDLIAAHCKNLDIMGANVYRGPISGDVFQRVRDELGKPFLYTEFGADAYDAKRHREDGFPQAEIQRSLWKEIYEQSHGKGGAGTAIGGLIFQWGDGWWKYKQDVNLDVHDPTASWSNGGYTSDFVEGENNMNEEWFGITAKTRNDELGLYVSKPRPAYYVLQRAFQLDPYAPTTDLARVRAWFDSLDVRAIAVGFDAERRIEELEGTQRLRLSQLRLDFETYTTWGSGLSTAEGAREKRRFDHTESLYAEVEAKPVDGLSAKVSVNVLGGVAKNPVDEIFYERRSLPVTVEGSDGKDVTLTDRSRIALYQASLGWENPYLRLEGFYRVGHFHWGYEGDFFGLYREAYHQEAVDMYDAAAPSGFILSGKRGLDGLTLAFGPEIYWGANPMILAKYWRTIGAFSFSLMHQEDVAQQTPSAVSSVVPEPQTRKSTLYLAWTRGMLKFEGGGILAGTDRIDRPFVRVEEAPTGEPSYLGSGYYVLDDQIRMVDTLGAKLKVSLTHPMSSWFVQGSYRGLVTDAGPDPTITYTGFSLKESGQGNHTALTAGGVLNVGFIQVAPLFLYQKPLVGPVPRIDDYFDADTGKYYPGTRPRNQLGDPFWVRSNRETVAFELLLNWDPTPATWLWAWDNIRREDAPIAASLDFVYRIQPTAMDAALGYTTDGVQFAFDGSAPAKDLWELKARLMINPTRDLHIVAWLWGGNGQSNGSDPRLIERFGGNTRVTYGRAVFEGAVKVDDWGPYDYHRDYNLTYPLQVTGDASWSFGMPEWLVIAYSRAGVRVKYRTLDEFSPRVALDLMDPASASGREWEVKSYVQLSL